MNLPHQEPLLFAKEILEKSQESVKVRCHFPFVPTLPMLLEAAAQASSAFSTEPKIGFLVSASDVQKDQPIDEKNLDIVVKKEMDMQKMTLFSFSVDTFVRGKFTIYVA